jgi:hypothetical protein
MLKQHIHRPEQYSSAATIAISAIQPHASQWEIGAAVIMEWNNIPKKLQRELFDNAGSMGDLLSTQALRGKVARFLHKHKDDEQ